FEQRSPLLAVTLGQVMWEVEDAQPVERGVRVDLTVAQIREYRQTELPEESLQSSSRPGPGINANAEYADGCFVFPDRFLVTQQLQKGTCGRHIKYGGLNRNEDLVGDLQRMRQTLAMEPGRGIDHQPAPFA